MAKTAASATTGTVYVLRDPRDLRVCYVGATTVPLATRLNGHLSSPASDALRAWIAELKAVGLVPMIEPLREGVPVAGLAVAETAEIHARTLRREPLLNVNGKAAAGRIVAEREAEKARRRQLTHWRAVGVRIRAVAGPLPPGFDTAVVLSDETWEAIQEVAAVHAAMQEARAQPPKPLHEISDPDHYLPESARLLGEFGRAVREAEGFLLGDAYHQVGLADDWGRWEEQVRKCVEAAAGIKHFTSRYEAGRYLALVRWYLAVMPPWRRLAYRCGIPAAGPEFHAWVTDEEDVREALRIVEKREPFIGRAADAISGDDPYAPGLLDILDALTTVYSRRRLEPGAVGPVLRLFARHGCLDKKMAAALLTVDPHALDHIYGPDDATRIDHDLDLPAGTVAQVICHLGGRLKHNDGLHTLVKRVDAQLPVAALPDITDDGIHTPGVRAIVASLIMTGRIKASVSEATAYVAMVRAWWTPRPLRN
ncbi:hypothetical protein [Micromonospora humida]|uniref:hypothetical protein n=1 Tax=Micromonospora humida TaxID=2809018 RepID=UPI00342D7A30